MEKFKKKCIEFRIFFKKHLISSLKVKFNQIFFLFLKSCCYYFCGFLKIEDSFEIFKKILFCSGK